MALDGLRPANVQNNPVSLPRVFLSNFTRPRKDYIGSVIEGTRFLIESVVVFFCPIHNAPIRHCSMQTFIFNILTVFQSIIASDRFISFVLAKLRRFSLTGVLFAQF